ncbi:DUF397 domain-containing protein [Streptomyces sichuanensis]|uniref:DUF397 domain-containing protein n=1 Tax=Streptomyces sichuanensis TaxID=2871810 RepID=UPI0027E1E78D|nr:DUF397 domain-containing protein [Streptomyces sichuanensis]
MVTLTDWQQSSYCGDSSNCLSVAAAGNGTVRLCESDDPGTVLAIRPAALRALMAAAQADLLPIWWQKSSYSHEGANCVNVAVADDGSVRLRESGDPGTVLTVAPTALRALIAAAKAELVPAGRR